MFAAESIVENYWINRQNGQGEPHVVGDWVMITCSAKAPSNIQIGSHVTEGANAFGYNISRDIK